ncbi:MAG: hypothetical protein R3A80_04170 [Bdellovibrionota bacterium]
MLKKAIFSLFLLTQAPHIAHATLVEEKTEATSKVDALKEEFRGFQIDLPSYYRYTEPNLMSLRGINYRAGVEYTFFLTESSRWLMHIDYSFAYAKLDYKSFGTGSLDNQKNTIHELKVNVGKAAIFLGHPFKYYWGLGYRLLNHDGRGVSTTGHNGYRRKSQYFTFTGGYDWVLALSSNWDFKLKNEISLMPLGIQKSYLGDVDTSNDNVTNIQSFGVNFRLNPTFVLSKHFVVGPYIDLWYIAESDKVRFYDTDSSSYGYLYEPENNTVEFGLTVGARF